MNLKLFRTVLLIKLVFVTCAFSQRSTARFLLWQPSARSYAMGGVGTALSDDATATYYNPANIAFLPGKNVVVSYVKPFPFFDNTHHSYAALTFPVQDYGTVGIAYNRIWREPQFSSSIGTLDAEKPGFFTPTHWVVQLTYAIQLNRLFSAGVNLGLLKQNYTNLQVSIEEGKGKPVSLSAGVGLFGKGLFSKATYYHVVEQDRHSFFDRIAIDRDSRGVSLGLALMNAGPKVTVLDAERKDPLPTTLALGISYLPLVMDDLEVLLAADLVNQLYDAAFLEYAHLGAEIRLLRFWAIRLGYFGDTSAPKTSYYTYGGGFRCKYFTFNIARYNRSLLSTWHFDATLSVEM